MHHKLFGFHKQYSKTMPFDHLNTITFKSHTFFISHIYFEPLTYIRVVSQIKGVLNFVMSFTPYNIEATCVLDNTVTEYGILNDNACHGILNLIGTENTLHYGNTKEAAFI